LIPHPLKKLKGDLMSLTALINKNKDLRKIIPNLKAHLVDWHGQKISSPLNKTPILISSIGVSWEGGIIGTAFDYMTRAILIRQVGYENAIRHSYVAEEGLKNFPKALDSILTQIDLLPTRDPERDKRRAKGVEYALEKLPELMDFLNAQLENAKNSIDQFIKKNMKIETLAPHALFMAKLDVVYRSGSVNILDYYFEKYENQTFFRLNNALSDKDIIDNIIKLSYLFEEQVQKMNIKRVNCNPVFPPYSGIVGGADADFIIDKTLIDVKTSKTFGYRTTVMAQILGYASMGQAIGIPLEQVGIYYARFAKWMLLPLKVLPEDFLNNYLKKILKAAGLNLEEESGYFPEFRSRDFQIPHFNKTIEDTFKNSSRVTKGKIEELKEKNEEYIEILEHISKGINTWSALRNSYLTKGNIIIPEWSLYEALKNLEKMNWIKRGSDQKYEIIDDALKRILKKASNYKGL